MLFTNLFGIRNSVINKYVNGWNVYIPKLIKFF